MKKCIVILIIFISIPFFGACDTQFLNGEWGGGDWFYLYNAEAPEYQHGNARAREPDS